MVGPPKSHGVIPSFHNVSQAVPGSWLRNRSRMVATAVLTVEGVVHDLIDIVRDDDCRPNGSRYGSEIQPAAAILPTPPRLTAVDIVISSKDTALVPSKKMNHHTSQLPYRVVSHDLELDRHWRTSVRNFDRSSMSVCGNSCLDGFLVVSAPSYLRTVRSWIVLTWWVNKLDVTFHRPRRISFGFVPGTTHPNTILDLSSLWESQLPHYCPSQHHPRLSSSLSQGCCRHHHARVRFDPLH